MSRVSSTPAPFCIPCAHCNVLLVFACLKWQAAIILLPRQPSASNGQLAEALPKRSFCGVAQDGEIIVRHEPNMSNTTNADVLFPDRISAHLYHCVFVSLLLPPLWSIDCMVHPTFRAAHIGKGNDHNFRSTLHVSSAAPT